jgi:hypothetical protein
MTPQPIHSPRTDATRDSGQLESGVNTTSLANIQCEARYFENDKDLKDVPLCLYNGVCAYSNPFDCTKYHLLQQRKNIFKSCKLQQVVQGGVR